MAERGGKPVPNIGGEHPNNSGKIVQFDSGVMANTRLTGVPKEMENPINGTPCPRCGMRTTTLEDTLSHETGHEVHDRNHTAF